MYCFTSSAQLTGQLTIDGQGNPASVFIFQIGSTFTTASNANILLINGAQACNVFWQIGSSAILGTNTSFKGNILALTSITINTSASSIGGMYARNGAVTLDTNSIQACAAPPATATPVPSPTNTPTTHRPTRPPSTDTVVPQPTNTLRPQPTQPPSNTAVPSFTDTPVLQLTNQPTAMATDTIVLTDTQVVVATLTVVPTSTMVLTSTPQAISTDTSGSPTPIGTTPNATPSGSGSVPKLPNTGSGLPWASPLILLLGVLLLAAGLRIGGWGKKHLR